MSALSKSQKNKALDYIKQGESIINKKSSVFGNIFGQSASNKERQIEDACELYMQAANAYKVGGMLQEAADTYNLVGTLYRDQANSNTIEAAKAFTQAGQCYKKSNPTDAVIAYDNAITLLTDSGRLTQAAKLCKETAEMYENDEINVTTSTATDNNNNKSNIVKSIEYYEQAAELFELENSNAQVSNCHSKIAELCSAALDPPDLLRASSIYNTLGTKCLDSNLLKFNAKGYYLQHIFCLLAAGDGVGAEQSLHRIENIDYTFNDSREGKFCKQLVDCINQYDTEGFSTACYEYDRISKLDPWKTTILVKIKRTISDDTNTGSGGGGGTGGGKGDDDDFDLT